MLLDIKVVSPPYTSSPEAPPFSASSSRDSPICLTQLPTHILLEIIYATFPQTDLPDQGKTQRQRRTLYWLSISLRLVDRTLYVATMHVLRSVHIPAYNLLVRFPYSSDPFPLLPDSSSTSLTITTLQRETHILDRFITLKVREDVWVDESELHLERDEAYKDLFDLSQPKSRIEDLVREYGIRDGVICIGTPIPRKPRVVASSPKAPASSSPAPSTSFFSSLFSKSKKSKRPPAQPEQQAQQPITPIPFHLLSVSFSIRQVGLILHHSSKRTIATVQRTKDEKLEVAARRLVKELRAWLEEADDE